MKYRLRYVFVFCAGRRLERGAEIRSQRAPGPKRLQDNEPPGTLRGMIYHAFICTAQCKRNLWPVKNAPQPEAERRRGGLEGG